MVKGVRLAEARNGGTSTSGSAEIWMNIQNWRRAARRRRQTAGACVKPETQISAVAREIAAKKAMPSVGNAGKVWPRGAERVAASANGATVAAGGGWRRMFGSNRPGRT